MRIASKPFGLFVCVILVIGAVPVFASGSDDAAAATTAAFDYSVLPPTEIPPLDYVRVTAVARPATTIASPKVRVGMYSVFAGLQVLDFASTMAVVRRGGSESNPLMQPFVSHAPLFLSVKAALTALTIVAGERMAKSGDTKTALVMTAVLNCAYAFVVARNFQQLSTLR